MRIPAASSTAIRAVIMGPSQPAQWLGAVDTALYFATLAERPTVFAVLSQDAVRLPCGLVLATTTAELALTNLAPARSVRHREHAVVGDGRVEWTTAGGPVGVLAARHWSPLRALAGSPEPTALSELRALLAPAAPGLEQHRLNHLSLTPGEAAVAGLLGRGPGLTPSGDDVLAGYLLAAGSFGLECGEVRRAVAARAPQATSALSAQLLRHAVKGEAVRELVDLTAALIRPRPEMLHYAATRLLAVGHTSGASLAWGVLLAGEHAIRRQQFVQFTPNGGHR